MTRIVIFLGIVATFFACVPNRKYVYLQKNDVNSKNLPKDTIVRSYSPTQFDYTVQPNDALYIRFESLTPEEYDFFKGGSNSVVPSQNLTIVSELVDEDGNILFPVIGKIKVAGMTVFQIQDSLQVQASKYLESAVVKVRLVNFRFTMLGEVATEGTVVSNNNRVTLPEAIGLAGGLGELADRSNVKVIRQTNGVASVGYVNLLDENLINSPYYYVNQNDVFIVPALRQRPFRKYFNQNYSVVISTMTLALFIINLTR